MAVNASTAGYASDAPGARAMRSLREWITDGRIPLGERLPSEQLLAQRLNVARSTIRVVLQNLEKDGLIELRGRGRVVSGAVQPTRGVLASVVAILGYSQPTESFAFSPGGSNITVQVGAIEALRAAGLHALCLQPQKLVGAELRRFVAERPYGIVALRTALETPEGRTIMMACQAAGIPIVGYGHAPELQGADTVASDHAAGSHMLTRWLLDRGRRRILRLWHRRGDPLERPEWLSQRDMGHEQALAVNGIEPIPALDVSGISFDVAPREQFSLATKLAIGFLLPHLHCQNPIDAIMATTDGVIPCIAAACRALGREPNKDVMLVGYDNSWMDSYEREWESTPPAATIDKNNLNIGSELVGMLQSRLAGTVAKEPQHRLVVPQLIVNDSFVGESV